MGCLFNVFGHFLKTCKLDVIRGKKGSNWLEKGGKWERRLEGALVEVVEQLWAINNSKHGFGMNHGICH